MTPFFLAFTLITGGTKDFQHPRWLEVRDTKGAMVALYAPTLNGKRCTKEAIPNPVYSRDGETFAFCAPKSADYTYKIGR